MLACFVVVWAGGVVIAYLVYFGVYVVQSINEIEKTTTKLATMLERDIKDTAKLMEAIK